MLARALISAAYVVRYVTFFLNSESSIPLFDLLHRFTGFRASLSVVLNSSSNRADCRWSAGRAWHLGFFEHYYWFALKVPKSSGLA